MQTQTATVAEIQVFVIYYYKSKTVNKCQQNWDHIYRELDALSQLFTMHWIPSHLHKQWDQVYELMMAFQLRKKKGEQSLVDNLKKEKTNFLLQVLLVLIKVLRTSSVQNLLFFTRVISLVSDLKLCEQIRSAPAIDMYIHKQKDAEITMPT